MPTYSRKFTDFKLKEQEKRTVLIEETNQHRPINWKPLPLNPIIYISHRNDSIHTIRYVAPISTFFCNFAVEK